MAGNHVVVALATLTVGMGSCAWEAQQHAEVDLCDAVGAPGHRQLPAMKDFQDFTDTPTTTLRMDIDSDGVNDELVTYEAQLTVAGNQPWSVYTGPEDCRRYRGSFWASEVGAFEDLPTTEGHQALSVTINGTNHIEEARYELSPDGLYKPVSWRYQDFYDPVTGRLNHVPKWAAWGAQRPE